MAKRVFPCGHKGKGRYCHRCEQEKSLKQNKKLQTISGTWITQFKNDPIDLRPLGKKALVKKARAIIAAIHEGQPYTSFRGKRMRYDRNIISVPVNIDYRLIFHDINGVVRVHKLMSHEAYNVTKPG